MTYTIKVIAALAAVLALGCGSAIRIDNTGSGTTFTLGEAEEHVQIEGDHLTIDDHIHFATNEATILEDSNDLLEQIAIVLKNHTEITGVQVVGHTDDVGGDADNLDLSERRAAAVADALRGRGVTQTLNSRGAGEGEPLCQEATDECRAQNRRVEFIIETTPAS